MALVTLCPACRTTFRVTPNQLKARGGDVRCGQCHQIFNSFATLITVDESEIYDSSRLVSQELAEVKPDVSSNSKIGSTIPNESTKSLAYYLKPEPAPAPESVPKLDPEPIPESAPIPESEPALEQAPVSVLPDPAYNFDIMPKPKIQRVGILAGLFFLFVSMGLTGYFYIYRTEITTAVPGTRPYLERFCAIFSCVVPYPQDITLLSIESSDLLVDPKKQPDIAKLIATIRNHAPFSQALPALKLTLTDIHNQVVASHIYTAGDYLRISKDKVQVIEPGQEIDIRLDIENPGLNSTGYQLILLYR